MKSIEINQMEGIQGGGFVDGFCAGVGIGSGLVAIAVRAGASITFGPAGALALGAAVIGCGIYYVAK